MGILAAFVWSEPEKRYFALVGAAVTVLQAVVYGPRAWRANRQRQRERRASPEK
jgi:hypothetical protein